MPAHQGYGYQPEWLQVWYAKKCLSQDSAITNCLLFSFSSLSLVRMRIGWRVRDTRNTHMVSFQMNT